MGSQPLGNDSDGFLRRDIALDGHKSDLLVDVESWVEGCFEGYGKENYFGAELFQFQTQMVFGDSLIDWVGLLLDKFLMIDDQVPNITVIKEKILMVLLEHLLKDFS